MDQRFIDRYIDLEISLGDFVLAGGELAALCVVESMLRCVAGVLGNNESCSMDSFGEGCHGMLEAPQYTRPQVFEGQPVPEVLRTLCERVGVPLFATAEPAAFTVDVLRTYLAKHFAERDTMHGVFMDILGMGGLITGESGLGKSELGLELISRGHGLVADDAVDMFRINQSTIEGRCPALLQNLLEVRGIGLLDIKAIFGETAVRRRMRLKLIVQLVQLESIGRDHERMPTEPIYQDVLEVPVRKSIIPVVAGRNIAVLVEAAVRNTILQLRGIDTYRDFVQRQARAMQSPEDLA
ncbi:MAG: HPr(Ser) kinase/phosphatase [Burkholderiaceae bacterium]